MFLLISTLTLLKVEIEVESMDKAGNFIGWLWIENTNLSVALVEEGLASVHATAERSNHFRALQIAETGAKDRKEKVMYFFFINFMITNYC